MQSEFALLNVFAGYNCICIVILLKRKLQQWHFHDAEILSKFGRKWIFTKYVQELPGSFWEASGVFWRLPKGHVFFEVDFMITIFLIFLNDFFVEHDVILNACCSISERFLKKWCNFLLAVSSSLIKIADNVRVYWRKGSTSHPAR